MKSFPIFKKYKNNQSFFKIKAPDEMIELKIMGKYFMLEKLKAKILPEYQTISDIVDNSFQNTEEISESEFEYQLHMAESNLLRF
jgi:hypothetical protein